MKKILLLLVSVLCGLSILCGCRDPYASTTCGDFVYFIRESEGNEVAFLNGLSEQGKQKKVVIVPETVDGYDVVALSYMFGIANLGELESRSIEALYIPSEVYIGGSGTFNSCPNLKKIVFINVNGWRSLDYYPHNYDDLINVYYCSAYDGYDGYYVDSHIGRYANVSYMYNYEGAENEGYYWVDNFDYGGTIGYIPENPEREGYTFGGWYKEPECINKWNFESDVLPEERTEMNEEGEEEVVYQETRLYAKWL